LGAASVLHEGEVDASNWMTALRATRQALSERPSLPPGASCSLDANGVATVLDPGSRRKFVLSPVGAGGSANTAAHEPAPARPAAQPAPPATAPAPAASPAQATAQANPQPTAQGNARAGRRFETVPIVPEKEERPAVEVKIQTAPTEPTPASHPAPRQSAAPAAPAPEAQPAAAKKKKFQTVAFTEGFPTQRSANAQAPAQLQPAAPRVSKPVSGPVAAQSATPSRAPAHPAASRTSAVPSAPRPPIELEVLLERNEDPTPENPLCYRERAYLLPRSTTVPEAEAALRWKLADLKRAMEGKPRGAFVNLAVFDHRWKDAPERPPVITLQWRDWRNEVAVDYPAAARLSSLPPATATGQDDRLAEVFEALDELPRLRTPAEGLDFAVRLLEQMIPSEATSACLYDINTDELRFVALSGTGATERQGQAVSRGAGLFGQAAKAEHNSSVFPNVMVEPLFDSAIDGRPGVDTRNVLLRPIVHEHQLLGMLQLLNRNNAAAFSAQDVNVINYVAERLAVFLVNVRAR
jgi:hypothetical protein